MQILNIFSPPPPLPHPLSFQFNGKKKASLKRNMMISIFQSLLVSRLEWNVWPITLFLSLFFHIGLGNDFFGYDTKPVKAQATEAKINKWGYIGFKSFCTTKIAINKMTRQPNLQTIYLIKGLHSKYTLQGTHTTQQQNDNLTLKWAEDLNGHFSQRHAKDQHIHKKCSTSLVISEM